MKSRKDRIKKGVGILPAHILLVCISNGLRTQATEASLEPVVLEVEREIKKHFADVGA